jgi:hypothetical protein
VATGEALAGNKQLAEVEDLKSYRGDWRYSFVSPVEVIFWQI